MKAILKTLVLVIPSGLIVVAALMISGMYREIDNLNTKLEQMNTTQTNIINWINVRQQPFNNEIIMFANNVTARIQELER